MAKEIPKPAPPKPPPLTGISKQVDADMLEPGENVVTIVHRSLIGLIGIYLVAIVAIVALFVLVITVAPDTFDTTSDTISPMLTAIMALGATLLVLILFVATYIYRQSRLMLTDRSLVQVNQKSLFIRKVSRLSYSNVEDVSSEQRGILASIFSYGTLMVQTAGERDNFNFTLCPNPNQLADRIIEERQKYAQALQEENEQHQ
ncbi:PH domain-containing protein [Candidatus Saccharibacteria bacterium]|nr:PH domain-containing protein [Candidatus Saccharibacteria bacterium]